MWQSKISYFLTNKHSVNRLKDVLKAKKSVNSKKD